MIQARRPRAAVVGWGLMFATVATGSLWPAPDLPPPACDGIDKVEHVLGYALLSGYAVLLFATARARLAGMALAIAFGIAIELAQGVFTATREPDALDVFANALGAALGHLLAFTPLAGRLRAHA